VGEANAYLSSIPRPAVTRADVLSRCLVAAGAVAGAGIVLAADAEEGNSAPSREQDERIFNFALGLEYLQAAFYAHALERGRLSGELREFARVVGRQERAHVEYIRRRLGAAARGEPAFDFGDLAADEERFARAASVLEESGVGAYIGQGANLTVAGVAAAAPIVSVEARHAAWIRDLRGENPAPAAADPAKTAAQVRSELEGEGFQFPG
jgi:Ferritin-like domain